MKPTNFFTQGYTFTGTWDDYFIFGIFFICALLGVLLFRERSRHEPMVHSPPMCPVNAHHCRSFDTTHTKSAKRNQAHHIQPGLVRTPVNCDRRPAAKIAQ